MIAKLNKKKYPLNTYVIALIEEGENQLEFPLELEAGQSQTGNIYIPGGTDMTTGLPMAPYTLDVRTSMGDFSYYGMAIAPSGNGW